MGHGMGCLWAVHMQVLGSVFLPPCLYPFLRILPTTSLSFCFLLCVLNWFNQLSDLKLLIWSLSLSDQALWGSLPGNILRGYHGIKVITLITLGVNQRFFQHSPAWIGEWGHLRLSLLRQDVLCLLRMFSHAAVGDRCKICYFYESQLRSKTQPLIAFRSPNLSESSTYLTSSDTHQCLAFLPLLPQFEGSVFPLKSISPPPPPKSIDKLYASSP